MIWYTVNFLVSRLTRKIISEELDGKLELSAWNWNPSICVFKFNYIVSIDVCCKSMYILTKFAKIVAHLYTIIFFSIFLQRKSTDIK